MKQNNFRHLYMAAYEAGMAAGEACNPMPMVVEQRANMLDDNAPVVRRDYVADGVCGFAWVVVRPGNSAFARWLKENSLARPHYAGGVSIWVTTFGQSMQRKEAYARAFAKVLQDNDIKANAESRMD